MRIIALVAMMATMFVGCTENSLDNIRPDQETTIELGYAEFSASLANGTKVELGDDTATTTPIYWNENDTIIIIVEGSEYTFAIKDFTEGQTTATFYCNEAPTSLKAGTYVALHKDGAAINFASQSGLREEIGEVISMEGSFTLAEGEGWSDVNLTFSATVSVVKLTLSHDNFKGAEVSGVTLKNNGEVVATATSTFTGGATSGAIEVYFAVEPQEFANTTIEATCGGVYHKAEMTNSNTLKAGKLYRIKKSMGARVVINAGECGAQGDNLTYEIFYFDYSDQEHDEYTATMVISGSGAMADYTLLRPNANVKYSSAPWSVIDDRYSYLYSPYVRNLIIEEGVTHIGSYAFFDAFYNLNSLTLPYSLTSVGASAFYATNDLQRVNIVDLESWFNIDFSTNDSNPFFSTSTYLYINGELITRVIIPQSVTAIKPYAMKGMYSVEQVVIHGGVTSIGTEGLDGYQLTTIYCMASEVPAGGEDMFRESSNLKIYVPITSIESYKSAEYWSDYADYMVGSGDTSCGHFASYLLLDNGDDTYTLHITGTGPTYDIEETTPWEEYKDKITAVVINDGITTIGSYTFQGHTALTSVSIASTVTQIGYYVFRNCTALKSVTIPGTLKTISARAFQGCSSLENVELCEGIKTIDTGAFASCSSLTTITLPSTITTIESSAFDSCTSLASIYCKATSAPELGVSPFSWNASGRKFYVPTASVEEYKEKWEQYSYYIEGYDF